MSWNAIIRSAGLTVVGLLISATGCQQSGPLRLSVAPDAPGSVRFVENKETAYVNPTWIDEDEQQDSLMSKAVSSTGSTIGAVFSPVTSLTERSIQYFSDDKPSTADRLLEDRNSADNRREGMNKLADFGFLTNDLFEKRCRQIAQYDTDPTVRATAIRTANRCRDSKATPLFIKGLNDSNEWVRLESAKALANVPDINAAVPLIAVLSDGNETRDVRIAAADALKHYRTLPVARALCAALADRSFAIAWQAKKSLKYLTDREYGYDTGAWLAYFTGTEK
jgi:hypothetical protein